MDSGDGVDAEALDPRLACSGREQACGTRSTMRASTLPRSKLLVLLKIRFYGAPRIRALRTSAVVMDCKTKGGEAFSAQCGC